MNDIDITAVQRAQSVSHYIATASQGTHEAMMPEHVVPVLTNPMDTLDKLVNLNPASEYFAANAILGSLGYTLINQLLWNYRKEHAAVRAAAPTFDWGDRPDLARTREIDMAEENGLSKLPAFDATPLAGEFMYMFHMQRGNSEYAARYPTRAPNEILHEMQTQDRQVEMDEAYRALDRAQIADCPAAASILAEQKRIRKAFDAHALKQHVIEQSYICTLLNNVLPKRMDDTAWASIPLFIQYKLTVSIYKQVIKAVNQALLAKERDHSLDRLLAMASELHLELEAAARSNEVKLAFDTGRLDERHELVRKENPMAETKAQLDDLRTARFTKGPKKDEVDIVNAAIAEFESKRTH